jgi:hypothetical protein
MSYPLLRRGDRLPSVAALQTLLNLEMPHGCSIDVDGIFGPVTERTLIDFQTRKPIQGERGIVGSKTWKALAEMEGLATIDALDITDPDILEAEGSAIRNAGGMPILTGGMCNGVNQVIQSVRLEAGRLGGKIILLRFYGHGAPATVGVSDGVGSVRLGNRRVYLEDSELTSITPGNFATLQASLATLRPQFAAFASVELHGCRIGAGRSGRQLVTQLAKAWGVPVSAGVRTQYAGGSSTFRFEGPVFTATPAGGSIRAWARNLPTNAGMCRI